MSISPNIDTLPPHSHISLSITRPIKHIDRTSKEGTQKRATTGKILKEIEKIEKKV